MCNEVSILIVTGLDVRVRGCSRTEAFDDGHNRAVNIEHARIMLALPFASRKSEPTPEGRGRIYVPGPTNSERG